MHTKLFIRSKGQWNIKMMKLKEIKSYNTYMMVEGN